MLANGGGQEGARRQPHVYYVGQRGGKLGENGVRCWRTGPYIHVEVVVLGHLQGGLERGNVLLDEVLRLVAPAIGKGYQVNDMG